MAPTDLNSLTKRKPRRKKTQEVFLDLTLLDEMSISELVLVAHEVGYPTASRRQSQEELIALILGEAPPPEDPIAEYRARLHEYVTGNIRLMPSSLYCDLDCLNCPATQVVECYTTNKEVL